MDRYTATFDALNALIREAQKALESPSPTWHPATVAEIQNSLRALHTAEAHATFLSHVLGKGEGELGAHTLLRMDRGQIAHQHPAHQDTDPLFTTPSLHTVPAGVTIIQAGGTSPYHATGTVDGHAFRLVITRWDWVMQVFHTADLPSHRAQTEPLWSACGSTGLASFPVEASCTTNFYAAQRLGECVAEFRHAHARA